ncbi:MULTISPECIES: GNAT family N-acetyltransferase [Dermacoccus]|uniref:N-acetyltransferase n=3 Tax=Dermacoccus TaxID=57495 RepID=A0A417Z305_9MICO|nr:GNAT family N-acetyltransferase [Dermacoccus abyssi]RHW45019.1 N-acetyltransferase [Dermacoccus abyssi]
MTRESVRPPAVVRPASTDDADAITAVFLASRAAAMPYLTRLHDDDETRWWLTHVVMPECQVWVAQELDAPQLLGFVAVKDDVLEHLYLSPEHRRRGIGSQLPEQAYRASPDRLTLRVFTRNTDARAFYERHGFQPLDENDGSRNEENEPDMTYGWTRYR